MHPLRVLLYVSIVIAIAVAWGFGAALVHAGAAMPAAVVLATVAFVLFMVPWSGVFFWAVRRANDLDTLTDRARRANDASHDVVITDRPYHAELDDLARAIEELRGTIVRQSAAHEEHRAAMEEIVASISEGLIAISPRGRIVVANPHVAEMFDASEPMVGRLALEVVRKQTVVAALDRALEGHASTDRITVGRPGHERQIEVRAVPVEASPEIAAVALFIDVTRLERLQRVRRDFLDDFSHEVRTPLAGLRSAVETLERNDLPPEDVAQLRAVVQRQIGRIERLVTDLSELNRIETGQLVLDRRPTSLRSVLEEASADLEGGGFRGTVTLRGDDIAVAIDPVRVQQIFTNLLDNASKHGRPAGEIVIDLERAGDEAIVRVSDDGPGIPPAELESIFHRFYRVDRSRSRPGSGLGLAIAKHLTALHGGAIRAFNRPEGGATLEVRLPIELT
jgi:two-component system phosphate regulon sensor histidine kinase PhoR